jgi:hypothetical protein
MTAAVSLTTTPPQAIATLGTGPGTRALASGRWLLYVQGRMLAVRDLEAPNTGFPQVGSQLDAGSPVTGLAPAPDGFYVFTNEGFGHLSMQGGAPVYERFASEAIRLYAKAYLDGTKLHVGGPSHYLGKIRVARLDVSTPGSPAVEGFADVEGVWGDFAYDGAGAYAVLGSLANGWNAYSLSVLRTSGQAIVPGATADLRVVREDVSVCHAAGGILYTAYDTPTPGGGSYAPSDLALWSLP